MFVETVYFFTVTESSAICRYNSINSHLSEINVDKIACTEFIVRNSDADCDLETQSPSDVSSRTCPQPRGQRAVVLVLVLRSEVLGPEVKYSTIIPKTLINSVHYQFITNSLNTKLKKMLNISY